jgi:tRNA-Thr(GGU) m(6)t(6)A37 methyltransferase TsaA
MRMSHETAFTIYPIGYVRREEEGVHLEILEPYRPALRQLDRFSHVMVFWWADRHDNEESRKLMQTRPPYAHDEFVGVFATRAEYRPNPIAMTTCEMWDVDEQRGIVRLVDLDACDGTPVLDLKAYFPVCDRVKESRVAYWAEDWPKWLPDEGMGLEEE